MLASLEFAYNDTPGASGFSPFEICYQRNPRSAQTLLSEEALLTDQSVGQGKEGADVLRRHARVIKTVRGNLRRLALEVGVLEKVVRQKRRTEVFEVGDHVALRHSQTGASFPHNKMAPIFTGPFKIVEVTSPVSYRLKLPDSMRISEVQHISNLKLAPQSKSTYPTELAERGPTDEPEERLTPDKLDIASIVFVTDTNQ